jgi:hypothetical protein
MNEHLGEVHKMYVTLSPQPLNIQYVQGLNATTSRLNSSFMMSQKSDTNMDLIRNCYKAMRICTFWSPSAGYMVDAYAS